MDEVAEDEEDEVEENEEVDEEKTLVDPGWILILMGLLGCGLGRRETRLVGEGIRTLRLGVSVDRGSSSYPISPSDSGETSLSGCFVSGKISIVVVSSSGGGVVGISSSSSSSSSLS